VQLAVVKGRARAIPPLVLVAGTQIVAFTSWLVFFAVSGHPLAAPGRAWPAIVASAFLGALLTRASARGDISIVGPVYALSPIFTVIPDAVLSGTLPAPLGWLGLALAVAGTVGLSGRVEGRSRLSTLLARSDARDALGSAMLLGVVAAVDRWGALAIGSPSYLLYSHGAVGLVTSLVVLAAARPRLAGLATPANGVTILTHGLLGVTGTAMQTTALTMAPAAYVNAIRRMSGVGAVILGRSLFAEVDAGRRLAAALLAVAGAACLLLAR
jgi:drug/metabolite transporter (DMT)-like permease